MTDQSREAFEAWASDNGQSHKAVERSQNGNYKLMQTNSLWMGWAAGYRQATEACVAMLSDDHDERQPAEFRKKLKELL